MNPASEDTAPPNVDQTVTPLISEQTFPVGRRLADTMAICAAIIVVSTLVAVVRTYTPIFYWDQWEGELEFYRDFLIHPFSSLFEQHNEHRLLWSRLVFLADIRFFGGVNLFSLSANALLAAALALLTIRVAYRHLQNQSERQFVAGFIFVLGFSWIQYQNFNWGFQSQWFFNYLFALASFQAMDSAADAHDSGNTAKARNGAAIAAGLSLASALSMASGLLVGPALIAQSAWRKLPISWSIALSGWALATWLAYFWNWQPYAPHGSPSQAILDHPDHFVSFIFIYLGSAFSAFGIAPLWIAIPGLFIASAIAVCWYRAFQLGRRRTKAQAMLFMMTFLAFNAVVTALGRTAFSLKTATSCRYTTVSLLLIVCTLCFLRLNAPGRKNRPRLDRDDVRRRFVRVAAPEHDIY